MLELTEVAATLGVLLQEGTTSGSSPALTNSGAAAIAVGLAAFGAGYAERGIGSAAVGAIAEDQDLFATGLIMTVLPETLVILALVLVFVV